jgi:N-acyl-D-aspartate/D-glutamate deacylase
MIEAAAGRGLEIMWDIYTHFCGNSYLDVFLPAWFIKNLDDNLAKPSAVLRLKFELALAKRLVGFDMSDIWIMELLMAHPRCLYATDTILKSRGFANPCSYGAFPRILGHFARDRGAMPMELAIHKMTGATARWMEIADRNR